VSRFPSATLLRVMNVFQWTRRPSKEASRDLSRRASNSPRGTRGQRGIAATSIWLLAAACSDTVSLGRAGTGGSGGSAAGAVGASGASTGGAAGGTGGGAGNGGGGTVGGAAGSAGIDGGGAAGSGGDAGARATDASSDESDVAGNEVSSDAAFRTPVR